jgi:serine phosphatase RsbU (regulator of sigma subunit)
MTVAAVIGALRTVHPVSPAWIINSLNSGLTGNLRGGFVTCCAARITEDGAVTISNAGHLSPYRSGREMELASGLPLGIDPHAEYEESHFQLRPMESLTFLSDGIIEARNAAGELLGFQRTLEMSGSSADVIANAAVAFGQDDDITVLKVTWLDNREPRQIKTTRTGTAIE